MNCPACGRLMVPDIRDQVISCGAQSIIVEKLKGNFCPNCDEGILDSESYQRLTEAQRDLVNAVRVEAGAEIRRIRKRLKLTQTQLAENFGLGPLAFSRYERGKTRPPVVLLKLMRLLENHPDLLEEALKTEPAYCVEPTVSDAPTPRKHLAD
jgi:HTH-type transcriptional regulator / antitoxin MqsA